MSEFKFVDLFAGIGGTRRAFEKAGGECVFTCEIDEDARNAYERNWNDTVDEHDIKNVNPDAVPEHDVLLACWPCPSFSQMGKKEGLRDDRGNLFWEIVDILKAKQPDAFLLENVKNLLHINDGAAFRIVKRALREAGYDVYAEVLNTLNFGLPQHRERLIIVGFHDEQDDFAIPTEKPGAVLDTAKKQREALASVIEADPDERFRASEKIRQDRREAVENPQEQPRPSIWHENRSGNITVKPYSATLRAESSWNYLLVNGERRPTIRELFRFQGFPDRFDLSHNYQNRARKLTGNTVPIPLVEEPAKAIVSRI